MHIFKSILKSIKEGYLLDDATACHSANRKNLIYTFIYNDMFNIALQRETASKVRDLLYTISFLINTSDITQWDFNGLREVYLVWNKGNL